MRKSLMKLMATPLDCQNALHSQSTKSAESLASGWLMIIQWRSMINQLMKRLALPLVVPALFGVVGLMVSTTVSAVGMGGINVVSALGQQLKADIELVAISKAEKDSLVARLASPEAIRVPDSSILIITNSNFRLKITLMVSRISKRAVHSPSMILL